MELEALRSGNDTGNTLWINQENMYIVDETQIQNIYNKVNGLQANSFEGMTIIDPALDVGDKIIINGKAVIYQGGLDFQGRFIANIKSKIALKQKQETTVKQVSQKVINRRVESNINQIEGKITQLVEENTETSNKLTLHEQTIDSMKDTIKSQETKIETVETKADTAKSTADTATSMANAAQTTANTANTTANNAKSTADSNTKKIQTTTTKLTEVEKTVDGITQSVSSVEEKVETVESTANSAKKSAENANSKIDSLQVGGRNFLTNTATEKSVNVNKASGYITFDPYSTDKKKKLSELGLKVGDKVTISFNWKISKNSSLDNVYGNFRLEWLGVNNTSQSAYLGVIKNPAGAFNASNTTGKVTVTIALTETTVNAHTVRIRIDNSVLTFTVSNMKLEAGNMATDWTPAPEDVENNLSSNYYTKTESDSKITQKANEITSNVSEQISTAKTEAINSANTSTDNKLKDYSTTQQMNTAITQKADSITTSVNKKITEIQVDADNLLLNTALKKDASNFSLAGGVTRVTDKLTPNNNYCFKYNISGLTADGWKSANPTTVNLNAGEIVTASANVYIPSGVTNSNIKIEIQYFKADGTRITTSASAVDLTKTNTWQRVSVTGTAPANTVKANARVWIQRNGQCWVGDLKLGRGNTVTSWCPSSKDYPTTKEFGTLVEQNWEHVKVAWNTICEYLQLENLKGNASLVVRDGDGKLIMSLDKTGQHYWTQKNNQDKNIAETTLKDITINNQTKKALMFLLDNAEMNGEGIMAWGYKSGNNVYPVLYVGNFGNEEFGLHLATDLIAHANAIKFQNAQIDDDGANLYLRTLGALKIIDKESNTDIAQFFKDEGNYGFSIKADDFSILDSGGQNAIIAMYTNESGSKTLNLFDNSFFAKNIFTDNFYANNVIETDSVYSMNGYTSVLLGEKRGYITCNLKNGDIFTLEGYSYSTSDERLKENIQETKLNALERIKQLNHVEFDWKLTKEHEEIGYIAQELEKIDKNYVVKIPNPQNDDVKYTVRELAILATATKAIQELNERVEKQDKLIKLLLEKLNIREEDTNA